ncbi:nuclear transport factor 2 family protein [Hyphococcus sp. DH-69]|uniref:nuclear transport factor 2 family protein n=1 Tax=Hyphococcus formosus TaxID=3143534 RepID=UPI00398B52AE
MSSLSIENRIQRLEALRSIDDLIVNLSRAFDAGPSASALLPLFSDNAVFIIDQYGTLSGAMNIANGVAGNAEAGFRWTLHYLASPRVELDDGYASASVEFYLWEVATSASEKAYWIGGRYVAKIESDSNGVWRFIRLELIADLISHYPDGWREKPTNLDDA